MNKYSDENKRRWSNPEYKKRVSKNISLAKKGKTHKGSPHTKESKEKIRNSEYHKNLKGTKVGEKNYNWKGKHIKYASLHQWINNNFTKSENCDLCKKIRKLEWSNKNHKYSRKREDWQHICRSCHRRYDLEHNK